jgi:hypothetical protein
MNVALIIFDIIWVSTMGSVWAGRPAHDEAIWKGFDGLHSFTIFMSVINIFARAAAIVFLFLLTRGAGNILSPQQSLTTTSADYFELDGK